jgi:hypothetical protein
MKSLLRGLLLIFVYCLAPCIPLLAIVSFMYLFDFTLFIAGIEIINDISLIGVITITFWSIALIATFIIFIVYLINTFKGALEAMKKRRSSENKQSRKE